MVAIQTPLHNVPRTVGALKLHSSAGRNERRGVDSCPPKLPNCGRTIGLRSASEEWAVVQRAIAGDPSSQDRLFTSHTARLYRTAFAVLRNKEDAEDAVQDGLSRAYTKLRSFQGRSSFSTWLTRIVINSALMNRRRKRAHPEASLDEILGDRESPPTYRIVDIRPDPEQICSVSEIRAIVEREIQKLPAGVQRAYRLHKVDGLSAAESIQALRIRQSAFKSRILRARRKLTEALHRSLHAPAQMVTAVGACSLKRKRDQRSIYHPGASHAFVFSSALPAQPSKKGNRNGRLN
jgi:RNA polymerase sigma-70 factor (ECF subfamily)